MGKFQDLTGQKFGKLTVIEQAPKLHNRTAWYCECDCGNENLVHVTGNDLKRGNTKSCGCAKKDAKIIDMTGWKMWEHGVPDSKIIVIRAVGQNNDGDVLWECKCSCGNENHFVANGKYIRNGFKLSCGCDKLNNYDLSHAYGIGYTKNTNKPFYFDLEDYELIKHYIWQEETGGYVVTYFDNKRLFMHNLINDSNVRTQDHINGNRKDNRKENLRSATITENARNRTIPKNNRSGCKGVSQNKNGKYRAYITVNKKWISLGTYNDFGTAKEVRLQAEKEYFGEFMRNEQ